MKKIDKMILKVSKIWVYVMLVLVGLFTMSMCILMISSLYIQYYLGVFAAGFGLVAGSIMYAPFIKFMIHVLVVLSAKDNDLKRKRPRRKK